MCAAKRFVINLYLVIASVLFLLSGYPTSDIEKGQSAAQVQQVEAAADLRWLARQLEVYLNAGDA